MVLAAASIVSPTAAGAPVLVGPESADAVPSRAAADDWTDARLVRECVDGNDEAWSALLARYKRLIYSIPVKYGFSPEEAGDIFQETCVELLTELPRLREPRALPKWLMQVTAHKCARVKQRDRRELRCAAAESDAAALDQVADPGPLSDEILLDVEREQTLRDAVSALSPRCRELVRMLFFESPARPYKSIANCLNLSGGSIGFIRGRCLQRLRAELHKHGFSSAGRP
jgi:RNA polymerase sigma factor (sigma-70 family)